MKHTSTVNLKTPVGTGEVAGKIQGFTISRETLTPQPGFYAFIP